MTETSKPPPASEPGPAPHPPSEHKPAAPADEDWVFKPPALWKGHDMVDLPKKVRHFVEEQRRLCQPASVYVCDGSMEENEAVIAFMIKLGLTVPLRKHTNCYLVRTDPRDVARVEGRTCIATARQEETSPIPAPGVKGILGNWIAPEELRKILSECMPGCMKGRTMFVIPFSMCPVESPLSRLGVQVTDSPYVVASMRIMTRMGAKPLAATKDKEFVKCVHSMGRPLPLKEPLVSNWPCNPEKTIISHIPHDNEIISFGSGYGGNSLLAKKCFALRIGCNLGRREGWLAEHMLVLGITTPSGSKSYIVGAFPSACGKTNLAMITPTLPGYRAECVGDDIAWLYFDENGVMRAVNPENGFFGVCPGTSMKTNPNAMMTIQTNTIFTNVAETSDGDVWWEGLDMPPPDITIKSWKGEPNWKPGDKSKTAAHPNSRFCTPAGQCPIIDPAWEDPKGVPVSAIIFGGRRPEGVPLVFEAFNWNHGVFLGACMRSETTAAAEHKAKIIMHDPFGMRPFFGYNFGDYLTHWLNFAKEEGNQLPRIYHVNWFRKGSDGKFLWPGFGENSRVLDWIIRRVDGEVNIARETFLGYVPTDDALNLSGLTEPVNIAELMRVDKDFWMKECRDIKTFFDEQVGRSLPQAIAEQLAMLKERITKSPT